ncbi:transcription factor PCF5-like isoform X1 [Punica granatum]|uniref:Transcription factor PCF5-like isoform X1 n=1 Tax=Punica granatum TaxID=22663 RepID=A0A218X2W7_PUNGR|nr:transcription factor PCF5-like isoform X1 [Punica granatum]XP_031379049.1 transcription factor PCF5-like isoform X1 [Punica granatum]OWM78692.1 hypothetical protein CDL15_Pgr002863 [Punica granatum]
MRGMGGEIVQVQGGHIVRSTGRKDRHSKVYTAKGPRDRRVRLSAHTAIQFYDVQDRLGYDRPSKAVDWLIENAKPAIDKLVELPQWQNIPDSAAAAGGGDDDNGDVSMMEIRTAADSEELNNLESSGFVPSQQPLDSVSNSMMDMISQKDLGLSLHSFQQAPKRHEQTAPLFGSSAGPVGFGFEAGNNYPRSAANWSNDTCTENRDDFSFNLQLPLQQPTSVGLGGYNFPQRGPLQSSFSTAFQQSFSFGGRFVPDGFPGMGIPGQVHDEEGSDNVGLQKPPSSSAYASLSSSGHSLKRT